MCVCVCVFLQPNLEGYEIHEVPLVKKDGQSLGISIIGHNPLSSQGETGSDIRDKRPLLLGFGSGCGTIVVISLLPVSLSFSFPPPLSPPPRLI